MMDKDAAYGQIIADRIQMLCKQRVWSINALANMSGLSQATVDSILHGRSQNPKLQTIHKIAITFNMTLSEFLDFPELNDFDLEEE